MRDGLAAAALALSVVGLAAAAGGAGGCGPDTDDDRLGGEIPFSPHRPKPEQPTDSPRYMGSNPAVLEAQAAFPTGLDLHAKVVLRTCSPTGGVCHNNKEYPDLHTPAHFLGAIGAPCNVQPGSWESVYDRCERPGDRFRLGEGERDLEIRYVEHVPAMGAPPGSAAPGLHIHLAEPVSASTAEVRAVGRFVRTFVDDAGRVQDLPYFGIDARWEVLDAGRHLLGHVGGGGASAVEQLLAVGVIQGDHNRNGVLGARRSAPVPLLAPGRPDESYLIARLRGTMLGERIPGSRMPLANQPLSVPEMLAFFCFVEGLGRQAGAPGAASAIDYTSCTTAKNPDDLNLLGSGVTWSRRVRNILEFNCGGCHSQPSPQAGLDLKDGEVYRRLLGRSTQVPALAFTEPGFPDRSYLWLKLVGDPAIVGSRMPLNPLSGQGRLTDAELADIRAWIEAGARENE